MQDSARITSAIYSRPHRLYSPMNLPSRYSRRGCSNLHAEDAARKSKPCSQKAAEKEPYTTAEFLNDMHMQNTLALPDSVLPITYAGKVMRHTFTHAYCWLPRVRQ